ncbi:acyl-CoA dehydrogenase family protein [Streptomyces clavuligerus]|uniref:Putative acyl-CoA dehydrogenase n=1 Tax=Streptomyces clavuligerus TaxID=1901 RepID=B5GNS4_STRCL|nr:acyl-CoA dehydrogenase family protein [Streptomyces clavuligerus]ANW18786.1 acyl-CoA dehydrogenase [Streptomyces clavuligerus]AXU13356.1 acyl-CoA dehydrogenase [Streptomyces clavuligerus]EDY47896.1 acyl-CoA dehydrogenase [Streptomyces clavuligerus]EFG08531.1 Putative acyl-CoA dehydrogenase [Streptomyces clavuligerus]MBY6303310.1 acyl-CoA dehydrogenase family protein [Streptomyces clavuligerus]
MGTTRTALSEEQDEIRRTLRALLTAHSGPDQVRQAVLSPEGHDRILWRRLSGELGLPGLAVPELFGGVGCRLAELALACEETGRALLPSPLLPTAGLAAPLIAALGTSVQRDGLLPRIATGSLTCALAVPGDSLPAALGLTGDNTQAQWAGGGRSGGIQARPVRGGDWLLYGEAGQVLGGHSAELLLVAAHTGGFSRSRTLLFLVRGDAPGLSRTRLTALDETRAQARVQLRHTAAELLGDDDRADVPGALAEAGASFAALLAAEAAGAAAAALDRTVSYVREREQFGRPIGSFQAVRHRLADLYVQVQTARAAAFYAARETGGAGLALAQCLEAIRVVTAEAVQLHGGIGITWEHDAHLYFKRAAGDELLFGPVHRLRAHAAERAGLFTAPGRPARAVKAVG